MALRSAADAEPGHEGEQEAAAREQVERAPPPWPARRGCAPGSSMVVPILSPGQAPEPRPARPAGPAPVASAPRAATGSRSPRPRSPGPGRRPCVGARGRRRRRRCRCGPSRRAAQRRERPVADAVVVDVVVGHQAHRPRRDGVGQDPVLRQVRQQLVRVGVVEGHDVGAHRRRGRDRTPASAPPPRRPAGPPARGPRAGGRPCRAAPPGPARRARRPGACRPRGACAPGGPSAITSSAPASSDPTGAQSPLDRQHITVVAGRAHSAAATPVAASALKSRAPSRWMGTGPAASASGPQAGLASTAAPDAAMCVFSMLTSDTAGLVVLGRPARLGHVVGAQHAVRVVHRVELDARVLGRRAVLVRDHVLAASGHHGGARRGTGRAGRSGWPSPRRRRRARPACPTRAAKASSSARTVGSSP